MKKTLTIALLFVLVAMTATTVSATATDDLVAFLSQTFTVAGEKVQLSATEKVKVERYLAENPVTDEQVVAVKAKVNETIAYVESIADQEELTDAQKNKLVSLANETASILGLTVSYNATDKAISVYQNGKLVESISLDASLAQTGGINVVYVVLPVVAIIAIAAALVARKVR